MKKNVINVIFLILFITIQFWFTYITFSHPYLGINVVKNNMDEWVVSSIDRASGATRLNIVPGDVIERIDGYPAYDYFSVIHRKAVEQADKIEVSRNGDLFVIETTSVRNSFAVGYLPLLGEILCIIMYILLWTKSARAPSASSRYLSLLFLIGGLTFISLGASLRTDVLAKIFIHTAISVIPVMFLHFLTHFFNERSHARLRTDYLPYLYIINVIVFLMSTSEAAIGLLFRETTNVTAIVSLLIFLFGTIVNFGYILRVHLKFGRGKAYLTIVFRFIWFSLAVSFLPIILFSLMPQLMFKVEWIPSSYTSWFILFFPLSFTYLITTKQIYDIHIVLRRILYTLLVSVAPALLIAGFEFFVLYHEPSMQKFVLTFLFSLSLLALVLYFLEYFNTKLESVLFPQKYHLKLALKKISKNLGSISSFHELKDIILVDIVETLQVSGSAIIFMYSNHAEVIEEGDIDVEEVKEIVAIGLLEHPLYTCFEINRNALYTSYLVLTRKKNGSRLGLEEIQGLNLIISYLSVSLENLYLIRTLTTKLEHLASTIMDKGVSDDFAWFRKLMFELQEKERLRIATDIHDTTMQDLFFLKRRLTLLHEKETIPPEERRQIESLIEYVSIINTNLRQNCFELHPFLLQEIGLIPTMKKVVEQEAPITSFQLEFTMSGTNHIEKWKPDSKRQVFRIFQELLNNAKKHSQADHVRFHCVEKDQQFILTYSDDGVGFDHQFAVPREIGVSGIGLEQMRSRVLYLGGQLQLDARKGKGVKLSITLPLKEGMMI